MIYYIFKKSLSEKQYLSMEEEYSRNYGKQRHKTNTIPSILRRQGYP